MKGLFPFLSFPRRREPRQHGLIGLAVFALFLTCSASAQTSPATSGPEYLGDIRRDVNGNLIVVPFTNKPAAVNSSGETQPTQSRTLRVGPDQPLRRIADAAALARDGDTIEIEAGDYPADVAVWKQNNLTLRGVGGRPRLIANGASAEGKAIWVIRGGTITVENIEFSESRVSSQNGAGIRFEKGQLTVRNCRFVNNENGILTASGNHTLHIEDSEFGYNGFGDGRSHGIYVGDIREFRVTGSHFHHANVGHLIKSRARENHLYYNRITDEPGGRASYEIDLPNGGVAHVVGNIIEKNTTPENHSLISFGVEGFKHADSRLYLIHNTVINRRMNGGNLLFLANGPARVASINNLLIGKFNDLNETGDDGLNRGIESHGNVLASTNDVVSLERYDLRPIKGRKISKASIAPAQFDNLDFTPTHEYDHPASTRPIASAKYPGAIQTRFGP